MLFQDPSPEGVRSDDHVISALWAGFAAQYPGMFAINEHLITPIVLGMRKDFPYEGGFEKASPFKKAANFTCYWVASRPIDRHPSRTLPRDVLDTVNAGFAFTVSIRSLWRARLLGNDRVPERILTNPIEVSEHSFNDIVDALKQATPATSFKLVSVLYEQLAYKTNPDCQYPTIRPMA